MRAREEALERIAARRRMKTPGMSDEAFAELGLAVRANPEAFVDTDAERAFLVLADALEANEAAREGEEFLDDDEYLAQRSRRIDRLAAGCQAALDLDAHCVDAATILALLGEDPSAALEELLRLDAAEGGYADMAHGKPELRLIDEEQVGAKDFADDAGVNGSNGAGKPRLDLWADVFERPLLRLHAAVARAYLDTTRFRAACDSCETLVSLAPGDPLGARHTWALALARLEDERGFNELDARFGRQGNAWSHLARTLLMFKLDRMSAARRALRGYASLVDGGAYALLRPIFVEAYLPDRPFVGHNSFEEAMLAVHEADPVVVDTPDFIAWCTAQDGFADDAQRYADAHDFDW